MEESAAEPPANLLKAYAVETVSEVRILDDGGYPHALDKVGQHVGEGSVVQRPGPEPAKLVLKPCQTLQPAHGKYKPRPARQPDNWIHGLQIALCLTSTHKSGVLVDNIPKLTLSLKSGRSLLALLAWQRYSSRTL